MLLCCPTQAQVMTPERVVRRVMDKGVMDMRQDAKVLASLGDMAAVLVTKELRDKQPTPTAVQNVLLVISSSFSDPHSIRVFADREPRTTLFLLAYLDEVVTDETLKKKIAELRTRLVQQYERDGDFKM
jgi:hypothetical protein